MAEPSVASVTSATAAPATERFGKIPTHSLADQARVQIRNAIFEGKIKPEERLTIERIASELGISRTPVREALKLLEADGIVRVLPNRGAVVQRFDKDELVERYSVRALLEGYDTEMACRAPDPALAALVTDLEANCAAMAAAIAELERIDAAGPPGERDLEQIGKLLELNGKFHKRILEASGTVLVGRVLESLHMPLAYRLYQWRAPARRKAVLDYHLAIVTAMREGMAKRARKLIEDHIADVRDFLISTAPMQK